LEAETAAAAAAAAALPAPVPRLALKVNFFAWTLAWLISLIQRSRDSTEGAKILSFMPLTLTRKPNAGKKKKAREDKE